MVRYLPASTDSRVGGDWYITAEMPCGLVLIAIGDVAGHGLAAAAGMARLRGALAGLAITGAPPERLVGWLNDLVQHVGPGAHRVGDRGLLRPGDPEADLGPGRAICRRCWSAAAGRTLLDAPGRASCSARATAATGRVLPSWSPATCCCSTATGWSSAGTGRWTKAWPRWPPRRAASATRSRRDPAVLDALGSTDPEDDTCLVALRVLQ